MGGKPAKFRSTQFPKRPKGKVAWRTRAGSCGWWPLHWSFESTDAAYCVRHNSPAGVAVSAEVFFTIAFSARPFLRSFSAEGGNPWGFSSGFADIYSRLAHTGRYEGHSSPNFSQAAESCSAGLPVGCLEGLLALDDHARPRIQACRAACEERRLGNPSACEDTPTPLPLRNRFLLPNHY